MSKPEYLKSFVAHLNEREHVTGMRFELWELRRSFWQRKRYHLTLFFDNQFDEDFSGSYVEILLYLTGFDKGARRVAAH
jgi:hypothetical protein